MDDLREAYKLVLANERNRAAFLEVEKDNAYLTNVNAPPGQKRAAFKTYRRACSVYNHHQRTVDVLEERLKTMPG